jgi:DNA-binding NarL/FixJ family response regulator
VLGMSAKTVMHHSVAIYRKLGVAGRSGATAWAFQHGVVD